MWPTTADTSGASYVDSQVKSGFSLLWDAALALTSPIFGDDELTGGLILTGQDGPGDPNTSGGGAPGGGDTGGAPGGTAGSSGDPNNSGTTGGTVAPEPGTVILTAIGMGGALFLARRKRRTNS